MTDIEVVTIMDRALIEKGIIDPAFSNECIPVHDIMRQFRSEIGRNFSTGDLQDGEKYLRQWLRQAHEEGASEAKLITMLRCGLGQLCYDFIEFTFEMINPEDVVRIAIESFKSRNYHTTVYKPPASDHAGGRRARTASAKKPAPVKQGGKKSAKTKKKTARNKQQ